MSNINQIRGLHHVTSLAGSASENNAFFTKTLGLRRVKKTVNFDAPDVYHLYYGDELGRPWWGDGLTSRFATSREDVQEPGKWARPCFSVPKGALPFWIERLERLGVEGLKPGEAFGEGKLHFAGPDGDGFALVEAADDQRAGVGGRGESRPSMRSADSIPLRSG